MPYLNPLLESARLQSACGEGWLSLSILPSQLAQPAPTSIKAAGEVAIHHSPAQHMITLPLQNKVEKV